MPAVAARRFYTVVAERAAITTARNVIDLVSGGLGREALLLYQQLHAAGVTGDTCFLPSVLKACSTAPSFPLALQIHSTVLKAGHSADTVTANSLLSAYSRRSNVGGARKLFDTMAARDEVSWGSMISCYLQNGFVEESVDLFAEMQNLGLRPKPELTAMVVSMCGRTANLRLGREIHARSLGAGQIDGSVLLSTALVDMYSRCREFAAAMSVFESMPVRNEVSWTAMISGCLVNGEYELSLGALRAMVANGIRPNRATMVTILPACEKLGLGAGLSRGKEIHGYVLRHGLDREVSRVVGALLDMYGRCRGGDTSAMRLFGVLTGDQRDVVTWSILIRNHSEKGDCAMAMELFYRMRLEGTKPNSVTMLALLLAGAGSAAGNRRVKLHGYIVKSGLILDVTVGNSLVHMYAEGGYLASSLRVFEEMPSKDSVSWSCAIASLGRHGRGHDAVRLFHEMRGTGGGVVVEGHPDDIAWLAVLSACNHSGLVEEAAKLFDEMLAERRGSSAPGTKHYACYVDLLGRRGRLADACEVIRGMPFGPSPAMLASLVSACRAQGSYEAARELARWLVASEPGNAANYSLLWTICADMRNWSEVEEVVGVMKRRGLGKIWGFSRMG